MTIDNEAIFGNSKKVWEKNLKLFPNSMLHFPDENLVRLFSGRYAAVPPPPARVMDHGFGHGNSLIFLANKGYECSGCEISMHLVDEVDKLFDSMGYKADLRPITGLSIPFDDNSFDIVVSWNVIHYNGTKDAVISVINDLHRILKPGGVLLLSTIHPENGIFERMTHIGEGSYLIEHESIHDNRKGLVFFSTQSEEELASMFPMFSEVRHGKVYFDLFDHAERHAASLIYGVK
jgi:SAM-dependent methyltransferase